MEGREGVAMASGREAGIGLFRAAEPVAAPAAKKEFRSPATSPSTSPTPSPPPAGAGHGGNAAGGPPAWSFGGERPSEGAGNRGVQPGGHGGGGHGGFSSGRRRGRPRGSGRRQILATLGEWYALSAGGSFTPHVIIVAAGEDVAARIMSFSQKGPRSVCILAANGAVSNVALHQPGSSGSTFTYEGRFEILQLTGSFTIAEEGGRRRTGGLSVSLAGPDGRVVGGGVAGLLRAATPIQVVVGSFLPNSLKQHQRRMSLQQPSSAPAPALPALPAPPPVSTVPTVLTSAMPISQASPGNGILEHGTGGAMNSSSSSGGFRMVGWPSPDINLCWTPQE